LAAKSVVIALDAAHAICRHSSRKLALTAAAPRLARARSDATDDGNADFRAGAVLDAILRAAPAFSGA
jgi:hypothetical protein